MRTLKNILVLSLALSIMILIAVAVYLIQIQREVGELKTSLSRLQSNYDILKQNYDSLRSNNNALKDEYTDLSDETTIEIQRALNQFRDFEINVRQSMDWFTLNRDITSSSEYDSIKGELRNDCLVVNEASCEIALDCMYETNKKNRIQYKTDESTMAREDFLKSLALIYDQKGGDCEDISLLFTAEYNYLVSQCLDMGIARKDIAVVADDQVLKGNYMYVVCGGFDPQRVVSSYGGHCVVALTQSPIILSSDVYPYLQEAALIEPQNGEFMFYLDDTDVTSLFDNGEPAETIYHINTVVTNNDLKVFYNWGEDVGWLGFSEFLEQIEKLKGEIK